MGKVEKAKVMLKKTRGGKQVGPTLNGTWIAMGENNTCLRYGKKCFGFSSGQSNGAFDPISGVPQEGNGKKRE